MIATSKMKREVYAIMEKKTIGKFIAALRKANGMTQKDLGEKIFVSDKTVSRWECDESLPELSLIPSIAEIFGITTDELLRGERNNPDRESNSTDVCNRQKSKSDKQFKLMLDNRKKRYINLSFVSVGIIILGLIAAMICNLGFSKGLLGFCLGCVFFVAATICQACFTVSSRQLVDDEDTEHAEEIKKANTDMVFSSIRIFFAIVFAFAFCLPLATIIDGANYGLVFEFWFWYGLLTVGIAFIFAFCVYKIFVIKILISKEIIWMNEQAKEKANADAKLLIKICIVFTVALAIIMLITYIVTSLVNESTFIKRESFDNPEKFIEYMQNDYDTWYEEGYGELPPPPQVDGESYYPNKKWATIDGKQYYYNPILYESIDILQRENGSFDIIVTTYDAYYNGMSVYNILNIALLSLYVIDLAACVLWYILKSRKPNE